MSSRLSILLCLALLALLACAAPARAEDGEAEPKRDPGFAGPSSVPSQIAEDQAPTGPVFRANTLRRALKPYYDWKACLQKRHGLQLAGDYVARQRERVTHPGGRWSNYSGGLVPGLSGGPGIEWMRGWVPDARWCIWPVAHEWWVCEGRRRGSDRRTGVDHPM